MHCGQGWSALVTASSGGTWRMRRWGGEPAAAGHSCLDLLRQVAELLSACTRLLALSVHLPPPCLPEPHYLPCLQRRELMERRAGGGGPLMDVDADMKAARHVHRSKQVRPGSGRTGGSRWMVAAAMAAAGSSCAVLGGSQGLANQRESCQTLE